MNPKIEKLRADNRRDKERVSKLQENIRTRDKKIAELESTEIQDVMHEYDMTPDELAQLIRKAKGALTPEKEAE